MILAIHILLALSSLIFSSVSAVRLSTKTLKYSYILAAGTLTSGVLLVVMQPATMVHACITGIIYFVAIVAVIAYTRRKLVLGPAVD